MFAAPTPAVVAQIALTALTRELNRREPNLTRVVALRADLATARAAS